MASSQSLDTIVMGSTTLGASLCYQCHWNHKESCKSISLSQWQYCNILVGQMQQYHACLHDQTQPTPDTVASQQKKKSWHDLAGQYGLEDMMNVSCTTPELGQGIQEEFELYGNGLLSPSGTDLVGFWAVSTMSRYSLICHHCFVCRWVTKFIQYCLR